MAQEVHRQILGLMTEPNQLREELQGGLSQAQNCSIDKYHVVEIRRGFKRWSETALTNPGKKGWTYKDKLFIHRGSKVDYSDYDTPSISTYSGTYESPTGFRVRESQQNNNSYFTTKKGVHRIDEVGNEPVVAGAPKGLDGEASLTGSSGFMTNDTQIAYRVVWGFRDANDNLTLGSPSGRITVSNSTGGTRDVDVEITIPDEVTTSNIYQLYRSSESASASSEPNDEMQLVFEGSPTSAEITAGTLTISDSLIDDLKGAALYASEGQQGILKSNEPPPLARDIALFRETMLYANTSRRHRLLITLNKVDNNDFNYYDVTGDTTISSADITNVSATDGLSVGQLVTGTGIPAGSKVTNIVGTTVTIDQNATANGTTVSLRFRDRLTIDGVDYYANDTESIGSYYFAVASSGTDDENVRDTAFSLIRVVNRNDDDIYAYYLSSYGQNPGRLMFEDRIADEDAAQWFATSSKGDSFIRPLPETGTTVGSDNEAKPNRIYAAKRGQPEYVPFLQFIDVGSDLKEIRRIVAAEDAVFVFKKGDGLYRLTMTGPDDMDVSLFDPTIKINGDETAVLLNGSVYANTTKGVMRINSSGAIDISKNKVRTDLLKIQTDDFNNFETHSFAIGYDTDSKYVLFTVTDDDDTKATQAWVFNVVTGAWTKWVKSVSGGFVSEYNDKIYLFDADNNYVFEERKKYDVTDYSEEEFSLNVVSYSGTTVTVDSTTNAVVGQTLYQTEGVQAKVTEVTDATTLEVDRSAAWEADAAKLYNPMEVILEFQPFYGGAPGIVKHYQEMITFMRDARFDELLCYLRSNFSVSDEVTTLMPESLGAWGLPAWGPTEWGGGPPEISPIRSYIPIDQQRANWIQPRFEHTEACTLFSMLGLIFTEDLTDSKFR